MCEPQLSKKGLYSYLDKKDKTNFINLKNFLQYADGKNDLNQISKYIRLDLSETKKIYKKLKKHRLIIN